ncbi:MAG TPA: alpha-glucosidase, partial [Gammaproteobacteria bacterium]|nr:alpha-glucosidase [Gammaproteobacteria bacterium]
MIRLSAIAALISSVVLTASCFAAQPQGQRLELDRKGETIVLEPYAPNILRVTLSLEHNPAVAAPGYGFVAKPDAAGWSASETDRADVYRSSRIVAMVDRPRPAGPPPMKSMADIGKYFRGSTPGAHIVFSTADGKKLLELTGWSQAVPNHKDGTADLARDRRPGDDAFYTVG